MSGTKRICIICGTSFSYPWQLIRHFEIHKSLDGQPHTCPECKLLFSTNESFVIHLSRVHCDHNTREYKCSKCDMCFTLESARSKHEKRKHGSASLERRTDADPTTTANVQLEQQKVDDCIYNSERFSNPLEGSTIATTTTTGTDQQSDHQTVQSVNPTVPFDPFWETNYQLISLEQNCNSSLLSRYAAFNAQSNIQPVHVVNKAGNTTGFSSTHPLPTGPLESHDSSLPPSFTRCRTPAENRNILIEQSLRQNVLPNSSTADPFAAQVDPSSRFVSKPLGSSCQNQGPRITASVSGQANEAMKANIKLKQYKTDDCLYTSERFSNPLEGRVMNIVTNQQSDHQTEHPFGAENLNPTVPFDLFWETKHQLNSLEQNSDLSVLSRYDAFNDAFFRGLSGKKNPPVICQSVDGQYSARNSSSSRHSRYAAFNDAFLSSLPCDQNVPLISRFQGQNSEQNLRSVGGSSLKASFNGKAIHLQQCRAITDNPINIMEQSRRQNALPNSLYQGQSALTQVSTAEPFDGQVYPSYSFASETQVSSCQNLRTSSTTSVLEQRNEAMRTRIAEHGNLKYVPRGFSFHEMEQHIQPLNKIQPQTMGHDFQMEELSIETSSKIKAIYHQPITQPANDVNETRTVVGATFDLGIFADEREKGVFKSSTCALSDEPYDSWMVDNSRTKPLNNQENMEQCRGQNKLLNSSTQGQVAESHLPSAGPSFHNVDTSTGIISYQTQEASYLTSMPCENNKETGQENADSVNPLDDLSSTLELSFLDDIQIAPPPDQIKPETVDNCNWSFAQFSHASQSDQNIQQTPATKTTSEDIDTGSYGISEHSVSSPNDASVSSDAIHDPLEKCPSQIDGNSAPSTPTAVTVNSTLALQEPPPHQHFCEPCNKPLSTKYTLIEHNIRFHPGITKKPFHCHICPKSFISKRQVDCHVTRVHCKDKPLKCPKCDYKCKIKTHLKSHLITHEENRKRLKCSTCGKDYLRKSDLTRHLDNCKRSSAPLSRARPTDQHIQQAPATTTTFEVTDTGSYGISEQSSSSRTSSKKRSSATAVTNNSTAEFPESFSHKNFCKLCNKLYSTKWSIYQHNKRVHPRDSEKPFQCHICPKTFITRGEVKTHVRHVHSDTRPHNCPKCEYKCKSVSHLKAHLKAHDKNREKIKCSMCASEFVSKSFLRYHLKRKHCCLNNEGSTQSDNSMNIANPCGNEEQNQGEASGGTVEATP